MSAVRFVSLFCDGPGCVETIDTPENTVVKARRWARLDDNWKLIGGKDICAYCQEIERASAAGVL